ncbi:MAG: beta-ketoacyl-[acyl-carrier-protein] synthase family protein, partial [Gammaproteobacteria bacterium]
IKPLDPLEGIKMTLGARLPDYDEKQFFSKDDLQLLDRFSQLAILAATQAVADAGLTDSSALANAAAVIGSGGGGKHTDEEGYKKLYQQNNPRVHPLSIPKGMHSAVASSVSKHLGIKGPVFSVASACSSGAHAIIQGALLIQQGLVDVALVGGTDAPFPYGLLKAWDALRVVSADACRPFSKDRSGMILGEGAGIIVLESAEHASKRGARVYAELAGYGMSSDAGHITRPDIEGIVKAMRSALENAGLQPQEIEYVNAHGTGTLANDLTETQALHRIFGEHARSLAISSTKSMHGHALGASSALEIIATALAMHHGKIPPTINYTEADEECDLDYVPNQPRDMNINAAMSNSFAFGGLNAVLVLKKKP